MIKKNLILMSMFMILLLGSCQRYIGSIEVQKDMNQIGIINPVINLRVTEYTKPSGTIILNKKKFLRSIPKELLTYDEKQFLDKLIENSISICKENLSKKFIEIQETELKSDFTDYLGLPDINEIHSNGLMKKTRIFDMLSNKEDKLLTYAIISDRDSKSFEPRINNKTGKNSLVVKKAKYDNFNKIEGTSVENLKPFNNYNLLYTQNNKSNLEIMDKNEIIKTCSENNLDALITINYKYQFERAPDLLSLDYKWRIRLNGNIVIYNNKGVIINENSLTGKSEYLKITKAEFNKIPTSVQFIYDLNEENSIVEIFEVLPRTEYSFSLQNIFGPLYIEATENFLLKLSRLD